MDSATKTRSNLIEMYESPYYAARKDVLLDVVRIISDYIVQNGLDHRERDQYEF
jgi:hypothetical protein